MAEALTASQRERRAEEEVLRLLLHECPEQLTVDELLRELVGPAPPFSNQDEVERAVRTLDRVGLLHREDKLIWPSRSARYFFTLELE